LCGLTGERLAPIFWGKGSRPFQRVFSDANGVRLKISGSKLTLKIIENAFYHNDKNK
jgi:hypothetical protein